MRLAQGLQQKELAKKAGLTPRGLLKIESGETHPNKASLRGIASALGLAADHFLQTEPEVNASPFYRIVVELDIPQDFPITDANLKKVRAAMVNAGRHVMKIIKDLDK